jgi:hypothetical protein
MWKDMFTGYFKVLSQNFLADLHASDETLSNVAEWVNAPALIWEVSYSNIRVETCPD